MPGGRRYRRFTWWTRRGSGLGDDDGPPTLVRFDPLYLEDELTLASERGYADGTDLLDEVTLAIGLGPDDAVTLSDDWDVTVSLARGDAFDLFSTFVLSRTLVFGDQITLTEGISIPGASMGNDIGGLADSFDLVTTRAPDPDTVNLVDAVSITFSVIRGDDLSLIDALALDTTQGVGHTVDLTDSHVMIRAITHQDVINLGHAANVVFASGTTVDEPTGLDVHTCGLMVAGYGHVGYGQLGYGGRWYVECQRWFHYVELQSALAITRTLTPEDEVGLVDALAISYEMDTSNGGGLILEDSFSLVVVSVGGVAHSDQVQLTDDVALAWSISFSDTLTLTDTGQVSLNNINLPASNAVNLTDTHAITPRALAEGDSLLLPEVLALARAIAEDSDLTLSDVLEVARSVAEADDIDLVQALLQVGERPRSNSVGLTSTLTLSRTLAFGDTLGVEDDDDIGKTVPESDTLNLDETIQISVATGLAGASTLNLVGDDGAYVAVRHPLNLNLGISDTHALTRDLPQADDDLSLTDAATIARTIDLESSVNLTDDSASTGAETEPDAAQLSATANMSSGYGELGYGELGYGGTLDVPG